MIRLEGIELRADLLWSDEFSWAPVAQAMRRALDGSPVIFTRALSGSRPITLEAAEDRGWMTRATLEAVNALAMVPGGVFTLEIRGTSYPVMFRHHDGQAITATPLYPFANPRPDDVYIVKLLLMTV